MIKRYAVERLEGEHFGDFVIRAGYIAPTSEGKNWYDRMGGEGKFRESPFFYERHSVCNVPMDQYFSVPCAFVMTGGCSTGILHTSCVLRMHKGAKDNARRHLYAVCTSLKR
ncbi:hypothetical protein EDD15DRAFT_67864 [Pisolithus albus]|nr:hypothetical protein EDD15DRAFT_67864 [Pisolithus albus]